MQISSTVRAAVEVYLEAAVPVSERRSSVKMMPARASPPMIATTTDSGARPFTLFIAGICTITAATTWVRQRSLGAGRPQQDGFRPSALSCRLPQLVGHICWSVAEITYIEPSVNRTVGPE